MHKLPLLILLLLALVSCRNSYDKRLTRAESLMNEHPDSALALLNGITDTQDLSRANRAYYALEHTRACDKLGILPQSDTLINVAVDYYDRHGNDQERTLAYFYQGRVYGSEPNSTKALNAYLNSLAYKDRSTPDRLLQIIYQNIGYIYYKQALYSQSKDMFLNGLEVAESLCDSSLIANTARYLGVDYELMNQPDSALVYYNRALSLLKDTKNRYLHSLVLSDMALCYINMNDYSKAFHSIEQSFAFCDEPLEVTDERYLIKGIALAGMSQNDSAYHYIKRTIHGGNQSIKYTAFSWLYNLARKYDNDSLAFHAADSMHYYNALEQSVSYKDNLVKIQKQHDEVVLAQSYKIHIIKIIAVFLILFFLLLTVFSFIDRHRQQAFIKSRKKMMDNNTAMQEIEYQKAEINPANSEGIAAMNKKLLALQKEKLELCVTAFKRDKMYKLFAEANETDANRELDKNVRDAVRSALLVHFSDVLADLQQQRGLTPDDRLFCIYMALGLSYTAISSLAGTSETALRSRKKRIKAKIDKELFNLYQPANNLNHSPLG